MIRLITLTILLATAATLAEPAMVTTMRTPDDGIQPQAAVDAAGLIHLIYYKGDERRGDIFYVHSTDGISFSTPIRVNSGAGSAVAIGAVRGAQLAIGKAGRVHVAWNGSTAAEPKAMGNAIPMLYTRMNDAGDAFEPQKNVITEHPGLDGGGSIAADREGHVYVVWAAPETRDGGEENRLIWMARSSDDGKTFAPEISISEPTGVCACCALRAATDRAGNFYVLYRSAKEKVFRDVYLITSTDHGESGSGMKLDSWKAGQCVMSTAAMAPTSGGVQGAWETREQVYMAPLDTVARIPPQAIPAPGTGENRKHPALAINSRGQTLLAWTEETGWNKRGSIAWRVFDAAGRAIPESAGRETGLPVWSLVAAFTRPDGSFVVVY